jgi:hypothetical protein
MAIQLGMRYGHLVGEEYELVELPLLAHELFEAALLIVWGN